MYVLFVQSIDRLVTLAIGHSNCNTSEYNKIGLSFYIYVVVWLEKSSRSHNELLKAIEWHFL